jgi:hypothetical protein
VVNAVALPGEARLFVDHRHISARGDRADIFGARAADDDRLRLQGLPGEVVESFNIAEIDSARVCVGIATRGRPDQLAAMLDNLAQSVPSGSERRMPLRCRARPGCS